MTKYIIISVIMIVIGGAIIIYLDERNWSDTTLWGYVGMVLFLGGLFFIPIGSLITWLVKKWF